MRANLLLLGTVYVSLSTFHSLGQTTTDYALSFNGTTDLVFVSNSPLLELNSGTLEGWFRPDWSPGSLNYDPVLIGNQLGPALTRYSLRLDRNLGGVILANGSTTSTVPYSFTRGAWVHLAVVASGTTAQVYVNGLPVGTTSIGFGTLIGLPLNLGSDGVGGFFLGQMDEVRIWSVTRSPTDIRYNVSRALAGTEPGLVAYWRLDEGIGLIANDATTNGLNGVLNGTTWTNSDVVLVNTTGAFGLALDLSSSRNSYVQVPASPSLTLSNQFTFEAWIKPSTAQCNTILSRGDGSNLTNTDYIFQVGTDGTNCGVMKLALMVAGQWTTSISTVPLNSWTHVAVTYDGAMARFYINGVVDAGVSATGEISQSGSALFIGAQGLSGANYFDGALDEVRVWNLVRTGSQIQAGISGIASGNQPGLTGYWRFEDQSGIRAFDSSGLGNHGILYNRPSWVPSFWVPTLILNGGNTFSQECHNPFIDPGAQVVGPGTGLAAGYTHTLFLRADGTIIGWGAIGANSGQATVPTYATNVVAVAVGFYHSLALKADGTVIGWGYNSDGEVNIPAAATNVIAIAAGAYYSAALRADGIVLAWGRNASGETNVPPAATNILAIAGGYEHVLALKSDRSIVAWGRNNNRQIDVPPSALDVVKIAAGNSFSFAMLNDGSLIGWGLTYFSQIAPAAAYGAVSVSLGGQHGLALTGTGTAVAWGVNSSGQVTVPNSATNLALVSAGDLDSFAVKPDGTVLAWGANQYGGANVPAAVNRLNLPFASRGYVNPNTPGTFVLTYIATNTVGAVALTSRRVTVVDTTPPQVALIGANPMTIKVGDPFLDPGATATDLCAGSLTGNIALSGSVSNAVPGSYSLIYTATDPSGNTASTNRTVLVTGWPTVLGFNAFFSGTNAVTGSPVVQFTAEVNPNGLPTATYAQYGLTTAYPGRTTTVNLPASFNSSTFYATLDGLVPGATYHFRIAATNSLGATYGPDQTFTVPMVFGPGDLNGNGQVSQNELLSVVSNFFATTSDKFIMTNSISLGRGLFQFGLTNNSGWNFTVLVSTNLIDWSPLPVVAEPVWQFLDPEGTNQPRRFYRIRWP